MRIYTSRSWLFVASTRKFEKYTRYGIEYARFYTPDFPSVTVVYFGSSAS